MKWYMNLEIGSKQLLAYLVLLALTSFLGLVALHGLGNVRAQAAELADRSFPLTQALSELRPAMFVYRVSEIDYVFTLLPPLPRIQSLRTGRKAESDSSNLTAQRHRYHSWLLRGNFRS
jgi:hypothetical protein